MRYRLTLEKPPRAENALNEQILKDQWPIVSRLWGDVEAVSGTKTNFDAQVVETTTYKITTRFNPLIASDMRLRFFGLKLYINSIVPNRNRSEMVIRCSEGA